MNLFRLFYLVEIRHRQLLKGQYRTPLRGADARENTMRLWQFLSCRYRKFGTAGVRCAVTGRAMLRVITFPSRGVCGRTGPPARYSLGRILIDQPKAAASECPECRPRAAPR